MPHRMRMCLNCSWHSGEASAKHFGCDQGAATQEIARNVQNAAQGTLEVTRSILEVKQAASDAGAAASQVLDAAAELARHSNDLDQEVNSFLVAVKAA